TVAILMIMAAYPELSRDSLINMLVRTVPIGIILVLVSQFGVRYGLGDRRRLVLNEIYVLFTFLWLFMLLGGEPVIHQTWGEYGFSLNIWNYLILIFSVMCINAVYYAIEYYAHRNDVEMAETTGEEEMEDDIIHPSTPPATTY
ncbi:MAG: hypothetical protein KAI64_02850, partial [Thermoplasmata archaeon]|nr:hypothetical protein [Thermoplasmata archaeon]